MYLRGMHVQYMAVGDQTTDESADRLAVEQMASRSCPEVGARCQQQTGHVTHQALDVVVQLSGHEDEAYKLLVRRSQALHNLFLQIAERKCVSRRAELLLRLYNVPHTILSCPDISAIAFSRFFGRRVVPSMRWYCLKELVVLLPVDDFAALGRAHDTDPVVVVVIAPVNGASSSNPGLTDSPAALATSVDSRFTTIGDGHSA